MEETAALLPPKRKGALHWTLVFGAAITVQIAFGAYGVLVKKFAAANNHGAKALIFSMYRDMFCFPVLLLAASLIEIPLVRPKTWKEFLLFAFLGLTGMFGNQLFYILGVYLTTADIASIFQPSIPVFTSLIAIISRTEPLPPINKLRGWLKIGGILAAVGGAILMITKKLTDSKGSQEKSLVAGMVCLLVNCMCMGVYVVIQKRTIFAADGFASHWKHSPVTVTAWCYGFGSLWMVLASLVYIFKGTPKVYYDFSPIVFIPLLYAVFISSALAYGLITFTNMHLSPSVVTAFWPGQVFVAVIMAWLVLKEKLSAVEYVGGALIVLGLVLVVSSNMMEEKEAERNQQQYQIQHSTGRASLDHSLQGKSTPGEP
eukprot:TRINITY_DN95514_c0_g1_i1.p1 TRINITY_DN95514_c0_g1~~TRINITY_DN95514_c0_g1_i1.p1  ORF type:complete len:373 (-),score=25.43 TRINITY_DN95514_c0_g1_i1:68-1186(-)